MYHVCNLYACYIFKVMASSLFGGGWCDGIVSLQQKISLIYFLIVCVYCEKEDRRQCCYVFLDACLQSCGEIGRAAAIRANTLCFVVDFWIIAALRRQQIYSDPKHTLTLCIEQPFFKLFENDTFLTHVLLLQHRL